MLGLECNCMKKQQKKTQWYKADDHGDGSVESGKMSDLNVRATRAYSRPDSGRCRPRQSTFLLELPQTPRARSSTDS